MQTSSIDFDISQFKSLIQQDPTRKNGWNMLYDGELDPEYKDVIIKTYKKKENDKSEAIIRVDAVAKGVEIDKIVQMTREITFKQKSENPPKQIKIVEKTSSNSDVIYTEMNMPFPLANREFLQKRLFVGNKEDPEVIRRLGLFDLEHRYYAILVQSTESREYQKKTKPVRGTTKMFHMFLEEDLEDKDIIKIKFLICQNLYLNLHHAAMKVLEESIGQTVVIGLLDTYEQFFGKSQALVH